MQLQRLIPGLGILALLAFVAPSTCPVLAGTNQVALFTGFLSFPGTGTGMDVLNAELATLGIPNYQGRVFSWSDQQGAFDWLQQFEAERSSLVIIGHSFGGNGALQLAGEYLLPVGIDVDLTVQIDPVQNPNPGRNDQLPTNVELGYNYYQISTGFLEPQGEDFVSGALNFNTEILFNDPSITHNSIDNDPRLHDLIGQHVLDILTAESADFDSNGIVNGSDFQTWQLGFGTNDSAAQKDGDANGDGDVNEADLLIWRQQYGNIPALSSITVPEPASITLVTVFSLYIFSRKRNRT